MGDWLGADLVGDAKAYRAAAEDMLGQVDKVDYAALDPAYSHRAPDVERSPLTFGFMRMFVLDDNYEVDLRFVQGAPIGHADNPRHYFAIFTTPQHAKHVECVAGSQDHVISPVKKFSFLSQIFTKTLVPKDPGVDYEPAARSLLPGVKINDAIQLVKRGALASIALGAARLHPTTTFAMDYTLRERNRENYSYLRQQTTPLSLKELYAIGDTVVSGLLSRGAQQ